MSAFQAYVYPSASVGILSFFGTVIFHATLPPDTSLYLHGSSWFYPSPLGRALGAGIGYTGMALLTSICAAAIPLIVYRIAKENGRDGRVAAWSVVLFPACWYLFAVSIDAIAAFFLVASLAVGKRLGIAFLLVAALLHLALLPSALAIAAVKHLRGVAAFFAVALCAAIGFAYMVATPYGVLVSRHVDIMRFGWTGCATFAVGILPVAIALLSKRIVTMDSLFVTGIIVTVVGGMESAIQQHFQPRYCLPGAILLAAGIAPKISEIYAYSKNGARFSISPPMAEVIYMREGVKT